MPELKQGMKVEIYCDPITKTDLEDTATLLFRLGKADVDGMERWAVKFDDEPDEVYSRSIMPEKDEIDRHLDNLAWLGM